MNDVEKDTPVLAKYFGIPTISILDSLKSSNNEIRFFNKPNYVICLNKKHKEYIVNFTDLKEENVFCLGNPHLDNYKKYLDLIDPIINLNKLNIYYASEPNGNESINDTSTRSKQTVIDLVDLLKSKKINTLTIFPHPRESNEWFIKTFTDVEGFFISNHRLMDIITPNEICVNIGSTVHYECILSKIPSIIYKNKNKLLNDLENYIHPKLDIEFDASERIIGFIDSLLNN